MKLHDGGVYLLHGTELAEENPIGAAEAKKGTMAYGILKAHNTSDSMTDLKIKFDALTSHDITYVGIIQTCAQSAEQSMRMITCSA